MIELIFIIGLFGLGIGFLFYSAEVIISEIWGLIVGIGGFCLILYSLIWFLRWIIAGGLCV